MLATIEVKHGCETVISANLCCIIIIISIVRRICLYGSTRPWQRICLGWSHNQMAATLEDHNSICNLSTRLYAWPLVRFHHQRIAIAGTVVHNENAILDCVQV